jgi:hypothetical protein
LKDEEWWSGTWRLKGLEMQMFVVLAMW